MDINAILQQMTLEDKIALCSGENFWETKAYEKYAIPALFMCDGPHGLRKQELKGGTDMLSINESRPATCFPAEVTTAASWDAALLADIGAAIGEEAKSQGVGLVLGPGANMKRNPLCGRNFEYFSEDPVLAGKLAAGFIRGLKMQGVGSSLKHFAANSQEYCRFNSDSVMDERTLRELYLPAFEIAVKEGQPSTIMCAYPKLNGVHCSDNKKLLTDILRKEWGFDGLVVTDWGAMNDRMEGFRAGCDLHMPGGSEYMEKDALRAVQNGTLPESAVDRCAGRILKLVFRACETLKQQASCDYDAHHALAKRAAAEGAVLLKNDGEILPLKSNAKIAVIGHMAKEMRYQGAGSSHINAKRLSQPLDFLPGAVFAEGCDARGDTADELIAEAVKAARAAQVAVVFAGLPDHCESEGFDRDSMDMPAGHLRMIEAVTQANPNTVLVLLCGSPVECPWEDKVRAILYMGLPGQAGGEAISDLLYGRVAPGGKLAETWPIRYTDCVSSSYYGKTRDALYLESLYTGYRYYDKAGKAVRWPFGYGLSYTRFAYSDLRINGDCVTAVITNIGDRPGAEIAQLYIESPQDGIHRPLRELKGFQKVYLEPGERKNITFMLTDRDFSVWQMSSAPQKSSVSQILSVPQTVSSREESGGWQLPAGEYAICVGGSSQDLPLRKTVYKDGAKPEVPEWQPGSFYEDCKGTPSQTQWERMMGKAYTHTEPKKGSFTMDHSVMEMKDHSLVMRIMYKMVESTIANIFLGKKDYENPEFRMLMASSAGSSLRSMQICGGMKGGVLPGMLEMANGHFLRGIGKMIKR